MTSPSWVDTANQRVHPLPADLPEKDFQTTIIHLAKLCGWLVHHTRPALNKTGKWSTPIQGDPGFPDLVLVRAGKTIIAELKTTKGRLSKHQNQWADALGPATCRIWRPTDWPDIHQELTETQRAV